jgi:glycine/D-amino acid oxidase-like deaminating enzyme
MLPKSADIVIIGGGAIGCSIAYHLGLRGTRNVVVLDRAALGSGSTSKAAGGIRAQFGTEAEIKFSFEALEFFKRFKDEMGVDAEFKPIGYLTLVSDEDDLAYFKQRVALQRSLGVDVRIISPQDAGQIIPKLKTDDLIAAVHCPTDGMAGPYEVTMGYVARAREHGIRFCEDTLVTGIQKQGDRVVGVETDQGTIATPLVVNAAGPAAATVGRMVGLDLKVMPRRRHIFVTDEFPEIDGPIPVTQDRKSGFTFRKEMGKVLMSPGDVEDTGSDYEVPVDWSRLEETVEKAVRRVPELEHASIANAWAGLRPLTPDEHAILGQAPGVRGMLLAVGFCGHGFQHSPPAGKHLAELILDGRASVDLSLFDPTRFDRGQTTHSERGHVAD